MERATSVARVDGGVSVRSQQMQAECELLFVASGRRPVLDGLNLDAAGIAYSENGIAVNERLQTTAKHVYAAGDVLGREQFSHYAGGKAFKRRETRCCRGMHPGSPPPFPA